MQPPLERLEPLRITAPESAKAGPTSHHPSHPLWRRCDPTGSWVFVAAILVGLATGSEISEIAYIISRYFGTKAFGLIYGVMFAAFQLGSAMGAPALAAYYDQHGNYDDALIAIASLVAVGTVLMLFLKAYPDLTVENSKRK